jgi:hypothetical protein
MPFSFEDQIRKIWNARLAEARLKALEEAAGVCERRAEAHDAAAGRHATRDCPTAARDATAWANEARTCATVIRSRAQIKGQVYVVEVYYGDGRPATLIGPFDDSAQANAACLTHVNATVIALVEPTR